MSVLDKTVVHYKLNDFRGNLSWADYSGNNVDVFGVNLSTEEGGTHDADGGIQNALDCTVDPLGSYLKVQVSSAIPTNITSNFTFSAHVFLTSSAAVTTQAIVARWHGQRQWFFGIRDQKLRLDFHASPSVSRSLAGSTNIPLETWTHVMGRYDHTQLEVYVDNVFDGRLVTNLDITSQSATSFTIGRTDEVGWDDPFLGYIDDLVILDTDATTADMTELFEMNPDFNTPLKTIIDPGLGMTSYFSLSKQNSFATRHFFTKRYVSNVTTSFESLKILNESLTTTIKPLNKPKLKSRLAISNNIKGPELTRGSITFDAHPLRLGDFLRGVTGIASTTLNSSAFGDSFRDYKHTFIPSNANWSIESPLPPYTVQVRRGGSAFDYGNSLIENITLSLESTKALKVSAGIISGVTSVGNVTTPDYTEVTPWAWNVASVTIDANAVLLKDFAVTFDQKIQPILTMDLLNFASQYGRSGLQEISVTGNLLFKNNSEFFRFKEQENSRLLINLDSMVSSGPLLLIDIPKLVYTEFSNPVNKPGLIKQEFTGVAEYDVNSNYAMQLTLINTVTGY